MKILYLGKFYPRTLIKSLAEDSLGKAGGMSNHNFEMSIIHGLCRQNNVSFECVTFPQVYSYPYNNKKIFTYSESYDYDCTHIRSISFCNLPILKEIWGTIALVIQIVRYVVNAKSNRVDIIVNTPDNSLLNAVNIARLFTRKRITQTVIIPDIPVMVTSMIHHNLFKRYILNYRNQSSMKKTSKSEGLVLLTKAMMDFVLDKNVPYIIMEGIVDVETMDLNSNASIFETEVILYTGTLLEIFGIRNLVDAFQKIENKNIELWICGAGDSKEYIENAAKSDSRIKFYGLVDSKEALRLQQRATILVNPRTSEGEYTKYSFPSKTMEYLLAGKSVIINRLDGIPEDYYDYVYTPKDESIDALRDCIIDVIHTDINERKKKSDSGRNFVITQKNSKIQISRIMELLNEY